MTPKQGRHNAIRSHHEARRSHDSPARPRTRRGDAVAYGCLPSLLRHRARSATHPGVSRDRGTEGVCRAPGHGRLGRTRYPRASSRKYGRDHLRRSRHLLAHHTGSRLPASVSLSRIVAGVAPSSPTRHCYSTASVVACTPLSVALGSVSRRATSARKSSEFSPLLETETRDLLKARPVRSHDGRFPFFEHLSLADQRVVRISMSDDRRVLA